MPTAATSGAIGRLLVVPTGVSSWSMLPQLPLLSKISSPDKSKSPYREGGIWNCTIRTDSCVSGACLSKHQVRILAFNRPTVRRWMHRYLRQRKRHYTLWTQHCNPRNAHNERTMDRNNRRSRNNTEKTANATTNARRELSLHVGNTNRK